MASDKPEPSRLRRALVNGALAMSSLGVMLLLINASFPFIIKQPRFPRALVRNAGTLQYTLYPDTYASDVESWIAFVGDSYGQGMGDAFLDGEYAYSIPHHLRQADGRSYRIFAKSGASPLTAARQLIHGVRLMNGGPLYPDLERPSEIIFVFFGGNDLDNLISQLEGVEDVGVFVRSTIEQPPTLKDRVEQHLPLIRIPAHVLWSWNQERRAGPRSRPNVQTLHGEDLVLRRLLAASPELSDAQIDRAIDAYDHTVQALRDWAPAATIRVVYIPSVVTAYDWEEPVHVVTYHSDDGRLVTSEENLAKSRVIRDRIGAVAAEHGLQFIDTTDAVRAAAQAEILHGPADWLHLNRRGYEVVAGVILEEVGR